MAVGRTFWRNGDFSKFPELKRLADITESGGEGLPCQMLEMTAGVASCKIQRLFGWVAKPEVCRDYPRQDSCHQKEKMFVGRGVCFQKAG